MPGTDIEVAAPEQGLIGHRPQIMEVALLADRIARTAMVPTQLRGRADECLAVMLYGNECGLPLMQSLQLVEFIAGKPCLNAQGQRALILGAGHEFWIEVSTPEKAVAKAKRRGTDRELTSEYTLEEARTAGLLGKDSWKKNPIDMLVARATTRMARRHFSDCVLGLAYDADEVEDYGGRVALTGIEPAVQAPRTLGPANVRTITDTCEGAGIDLGDVVERATEGRTRDITEVLTTEVGAIRDAVKHYVENKSTDAVSTPAAASGEAAGEESAAHQPDPPAATTSKRARTPGEATKARCFALVNKLGWSDEERHAYAAVVLGKAVPTFTDLSLDEYHALNAVFEDVEQGKATIHLAEGGKAGYTEYLA